MLSYFDKLSIQFLHTLNHSIFQVEVYQSDFNAERQAREKIAGEKADLVEEIRRLKNTQPNAAFENNIEVTVFEKWEMNEKNYLYMTICNFM